jgi:uncharacterized membrane protein
VHEAAKSLESREEHLANTFQTPRGAALHPVHAVLLASMLPLYVGALLSDLAYGSTYEVQWTNFASWLIVGGLLFTGLALLWALLDLLRADIRWRRQSLLYFLLLLATLVAGFGNALIHGKDAWATMPEGLILSIIVSALAVATVWVGFSSWRTGAGR